MVTWGMAASAMMLVHSPWSFYGLRFLLGVAEAGFFPGIIFYLTYWYPARERARAYAWFLAAIPVCGVIGGPISGALLGLDGRLGLQGWQWLFLLEGIPSIVVGIAVLWLLPDRPRDARWLQPAESASLEALLEAERADAVTPHGASLWRALGNPMVWWLGLSYFLLVVALYGFTLWLPQLVKASGEFSNFEVGVITAIPYAVAAVGMVLVGRSSDRSGERHLHLALPAIAGRAGLPGDHPHRDHGPADRRAVAHRVRRARLAGTLLGPADRVPPGARGGGRHRTDQLDGRGGRVRRTLSDRQRAGADRRFRAGAPVDGGIIGGRGGHRPGPALQGGRTSRRRRAQRMRSLG